MAVDEAGSGDWRPPTEDELDRVVAQLTGARSLPGAVLRQVGRAFRVRDGRPFDLHIRRRKLPNASVAVFSVSEMVLRRLPFSRPNAAHLVIVRDGAVAIESRDGRRYDLAAGEMCIVTQWSEFELTCPLDARVTHLVLTESRLRARGVRLSDERILLGSQVSLRDPIIALVDSVVERDWMASPSAVRVIDRALEDLVVGVLLERGDEPDEHDEQRAQLRARAIEEIATRHRDRSLNPAVIARYLGVSLRHLQRAFEHSGTSVADQIALRRSASAAELLAAHDTRHLTVRDVAVASGFSSPFELRSAFRARYGSLPSEYRTASIRAEDNLAPARE